MKCKYDWAKHWKTYSTKHPERVKESQKKTRLKNKDKMLEATRKWKLKNKERCRELNRLSYKKHAKEIQWKRKLKWCLGPNYNELLR